MRPPAEFIEMCSDSGMAERDAVIAWEIGNHAAMEAAKTLSRIAETAPSLSAPTAHLIALRILARHCVMAADILVADARSRIAARGQ